MEPIEVAEPAELVFIGGRIWTGAEEAPSDAGPEAVAVTGEEIAAVGSRAEVERLIGPDTEVVDLGDGLLVPGFIDSHVHFLDSGFKLSAVQLRDAETPAEFTERIARFAAGLPAGAWVTGGDWDHENWGGELPDRSWIDAITPDNPVWVHRLDGHMALANSLALEAAGIGPETPDVEGGTFVRDAGGRLTGVLKDNAMEAVARVVPPPSPEQEDQALAAAMAHVASHGVVAVHHMGTWDDLEVFARNHARGALRTRIYAAVPLADWQRLAARVESQGRGDAWLQTGALKGFVDGSLGSHTAAFFEPYTDAPGDRGLLVNEPQALREWIRGADRAGLHLVVHAIGDRANALLLDLFAAAIEANGPRDRRFRIEHAQHLRPADVGRFAALGVIASMQPYHAIDDGRWAERLIGPERARTTYAFRALLDAGAELAFGSDWSVAPAEPLLGIYAAVTRRTLDGAHPDGWVPEEKITVEEALRAYTLGGARASFAEARRGTIEPGKLADLVLLDRDLTRIPPESIPDTRVLRTVIGGRTVLATTEATTERTATTEPER